MLIALNVPWLLVGGIDQKTELQMFVVKLLNVVNMF